MKVVVYVLTRPIPKVLISDNIIIWKSGLCSSFKKGQAEENNPVAKNSEKVKKKI